MIRSATSTVHAGPRRSVWSVVALVSAVVAWLGVLSYTTLTVLAVPAAVLAVVSGVLGAIRDRRPVWRVVAGLCAVLTLGLALVVGLLVWFLSAGGPTT